MWSSAKIYQTVWWGWNSCSRTNGQPEPVYWKMRWATPVRNIGCFFFFLRATSFDGYGAYIKRYLATAQFFVPKRFCCPWGLGRQTVEEMSIRPLAQWLQRPFANWMAVEEIPTGCLLPKHLRSSQYVIIVFSIMPLSSAAYQVYSSFI